MFTCDAHVHFFAEAAAQSPQAWGDALREPHWTRLVTDGPQGWCSESELLRQMDADGVDHAVLVGWYWQQATTAEAENRRIAELVRRHPDRLSAWAALSPAPGASFLPAAEQALELGFCGFGELLPQVQGFSLSEPRWQEFADWAAERGLPVMFHVTEPVGHNYPGRVETPLMDYVAAIEAQPKLKWVLAHWGGGLPFFGLNPRIRKALQNVWIDTAASPLLYNADIWNQIPAIFPVERILLGSDYPLKLYPRRKDQPSFSGILNELEQSGLTAVEKAAIRGTNAWHLIGRD
ncbi:MAG: amidohydrolase [Opitutales bacterium]|nr:amidohydrolase [Opitutales bacterium]